MTDSTLILLSVEDGIATVTINRPERRNALSWEAMTELRAVLARVKDDPDARVVVLTGAGDKAFCAGADLGGMRAEDDFLRVHNQRGELAGLLHDLWGLGKPTIARVRGYALAGGFGVALGCDIVVAAADAVFGAPEIDRGLWAHMVTVPLLRSMPPKVVLELLMTGRRVDAEEALRLGFVNRVVPASALDDTVRSVALPLTEKSPAVMRLGRDAFYAVCDQPADDALRLLHALLTVTTSTEDAAEGVAAFHEKRPPVWRGR